MAFGGVFGGGSGEAPGMLEDTSEVSEVELVSVRIKQDMVWSWHCSRAVDC